MDWIDQVFSNFSQILVHLEKNGLSNKLWKWYKRLEKESTTMDPNGPQVSFSAKGSSDVSEIKTLINKTHNISVATIYFFLDLLSC